MVTAAKSLETPDHKPNIRDPENLVMGPGNGYTPWHYTWEGVQK